MLTYLIIFSGIMIIILSFLLFKKIIINRYIKLTFIYILLFMMIFIISILTFKNPILVKEFIKNGVYVIASKGHLQETATSNFVEKSEAPLVKIADNILLDIKGERQLPELPRGCEVTSLSMLLQSAGVKVDKLTLANEIKKNPTPFKKVNGKIYFGHPNDGFVGNMYDKRFPGLGVYHKPIKELADQYLPLQVVDLTGESFEEVEMYLSNGSPVWVIINTTFKKLNENQFETWNTPSGIIKVTYYEHSVLITGFDNENVYVNDPLTGEKNKKLRKDEFISAWEQMGRQAISYSQ